MAVTISAAQQNQLSNSQNPMSFGNKKMWVGTLSGDSSYPTGGYTLDPALFGLSFIDFVLVASTLVVGAGGAATYWVWNFSTRTLQAFVPAGTEVVGGTNVSAVTRFCQVMIVGH